MSDSRLRVPADLVLCPGITPAAKIVWMVLRLDARVEPLRSPTRLAERTGLTRLTVRRALDQLVETQWMPSSGAPKSKDRRWSAARLNMPVALITDGMLNAQARIMYGVVQQTPGFHHSQGSFTHRRLGQLAHLRAGTARKAIEQLTQAGWLEISQANRSVRFTLRNPVSAQSDQAVARVKRRIDRARFLGEALMREYLSVIVDSDNFEDDAAPGFLLNPLTDERLEFDRFYPPGVAFEFNGSQHYVAGGGFSPEEVAEQQARDLMKAGRCQKRGITLVVVHPPDLTLPKMREKVGQLLPLRDLHGLWPVVNHLERVSRFYRGKARRVKGSVT